MLPRIHCPDPFRKAFLVMFFKPFQPFPPPFRPAVFPVALVAFFAILAIWPGRAAAQFAVCNQSLDVVNVAVGQPVDDAFQTEGWWTIGPNQCANVIKAELSSRYIYLYAQDVFGQPLLNGTTQMCISPRKFSIRGITECWSRGDVAAGFIEVDTQKTQRWTLFLSPGQ